MQAGVLEGEAQREAHRARRVAAAERVLVDPVAERGVLPGAAHDVGERDAPDEPVVVGGVQDREREGGPVAPRLDVELQLEALSGGRIERLFAQRLPGPGVVAVGDPQRHELVEVGHRAGADRRRAALEPNARGLQQPHRPEATSARSSEEPHTRQ